MFRRRRSGLGGCRASHNHSASRKAIKRYERAATIITSNLDFDEWDQAFPASIGTSNALFEQSGE